MIYNLEHENNNLNAKAEFYEEVAESLVIENESLLLKLQYIEEQKTKGKSVSFNLNPKQNDLEREEEEDKLDNEEIVGKEEEADEEIGFRQQSRRVTCIVCGRTRNT